MGYTYTPLDRYVQQSTRRGLPSKSLSGWWDGFFAVPSIMFRQMVQTVLGPPTTVGRKAIKWGGGR